MRNKLKQSKRLWIAVAGVILTMGVLATVWKYFEWKHLETDKFGQGWSDMDKPAMGLTELVNDKENRVRFRLPSGWEVGNNLDFSVRQAEGNLTDIVDLRVAELKNSEVNIVGEREYISTEKSNLTVITFEVDHLGGKVDLIQEAWAKSGNKLVVLKAEVPEEKWTEVKKTYWEIFKSLEI
jgi:hypothetical protein